jgi:pseudaminic acid cytidylyltransferase
MNNLAIIPARGGSKRIPKKNIRPFLGKPIIAYSIEVAIESKLFSEIIVSTDDKEIADLASSYGAKVPFYRSEKNSDDFSSTLDVLKEVLLKYKELNCVFDNLCCIYPCAPFTTTDNLNKAFNLLVQNNYNSVFPVVEFQTPIQRALKIIDEHKIICNQQEYTNSRTQDLEKFYHDSGQFYWLKSNAALFEESIFSSNSGCIILNELHAHDIDNENDWKFAELKYKLL